MTGSASRKLVQLDKVNVDVAGTRILHDVSWALEAGTHWGIIGGNGSGKSTFLALVAGMRWPAPGGGRRRYDFGDGPERDAVSARQRITLVGHELQDRYTKWGWNFTAADVVASGLKRADIPRRQLSAAERERALRLLEELDLGDLSGRRFLELSRGQQRRVLIARSFAFAPDVLLLDEPASGLDTASRVELEQLIEQIGRTTTIVAAAHGRDELPRVVTHLVELAGGRIRARGPLPPRGPGAGTRATVAASPTAAAAEAPLIEIDKASVWLSGRCVLDALDWQLGASEHWLITGPNGAGKSTLLRLLHGQVRPELGGTLRWPGLGEPRDVWTLRRLIGWVSAELAAGYLYPATVAECIGSGFAASIGLTRQLDRSESQRVAELIAAFGLGELASRPLASLSYGQRHRALIARALAVRPRVLLLDEPWEGLDADAGRLVRARITDAMRAGTRIVCASHIGDGGLSLTHEMRLEAGRIIRAGPRTAAGDGAYGARRESSASERNPG